MLRHVNKHRKGLAGNISEYLCNFSVGKKSLSSMIVKEKTTKEKIEFNQLKMQNSYTVKKINQIKRKLNLQYMDQRV